MSYDPHNPLTVSLPYNFINHDYPTEIMANRFNAWRSTIKELVNYFKEYSSVQEEIIRQQARLQQAVGSVTRSGQLINQSSSSASIRSNSNHHHHGNNNSNTPKDDYEAISKFFLPVGNGSIQDVPRILFKYHQQNAINGSKTLKEINNIIIPKLEELRKDLLIKIKEINNLQNDFKNNLSKELNETKTLISQYNQSIEISNKLDNGSLKNNSTHHHLIENSSSSSESFKFDPYLVKIKLDRQLKKQLVEENYLYDAYANLQNAGKQLESIVVLEIQNYLSNFLNLVNEENSTFSKFLLPNISNGFLGKESNFEWDAFIERNLPSINNISSINNSNSVVKNGTFIDLNIPKRQMNEFLIKNFDSNLNISIREGYLERRSKFLKNYSSAWYVLTCSFIHEFKSNDRKKDPLPVMSLALDSCTVSDHSKDDGKSDGIYKFILTSRSSNTLMSKTHKWVFRTNTFKNMIDWFNDIKKMTSLPTPSSRARSLGNNNNHKSNTITSTSSLNKVVSRNSSIRSPAKSIRTHTSESNQQYQQQQQQQQQQQRRTNSVKQRPLSQATSIANANRLSSTFSQRNNQSPRLTNMINSDGTIITPVDTHEDLKKYPTNNSNKYSIDQSYPQQQNSYVPFILQGQQSPPIQHNPNFHLIPVDSMGSSGQPLLVPQQQPPSSQPPSSQPSQSQPPSGYQYYIAANAQQAQQFYDPVQQQYYTITPSVPIQQKSNQNQNNQPQPQYFQTTSSPQQLSTSPMAQPNYFPQFIHAQQLPYPTSIKADIESHDNSVVNDEEKNEDQKNDNGHNVPARQLSADEVSTLKSDDANTYHLNNIANNDDKGSINIVISNEDNK
ncbi:unnamed protein product [Candida verbasci]|uniref:PH domain-containing protein n=1 Tax=Candida verbasci TaxID=1227364 RepID=A0A9W4U0K3_9ASCO|nr:unnamed protein product [Candida verbasci]